MKVCQDIMGELMSYVRARRDRPIAPSGDEAKALLDAHLLTQGLIEPERRVAVAKAAIAVLRPKPLPYVR